VIDILKYGVGDFIDGKFIDDTIIDRTFPLGISQRTLQR